MRRPLGVPVVHVVAGETEQLPRAGLAPDEGVGGAAQVAHFSVCSPWRGGADLLVVRLGEEPGGGGTVAMGGRGEGRSGPRLAGAGRRLGLEKRRRVYN